MKLLNTLENNLWRKFLFTDRYKTSVVHHLKRQDCTGEIGRALIQTVFRNKNLVKKKRVPLRTNKAHSRTAYTSGPKNLDLSMLYLCNTSLHNLKTNLNLYLQLQ